MRVETGVVQFGDDWPGVFIRGDDAFGYGIWLDEALEALSATGHPLLLMQIRGLRATVAGADVRSAGHQPRILPAPPSEPGPSREQQ